MPGEPLSHAQGELILILQENPALCMPVNPEEKIDKYIINLRQSFQSIFRNV